MQVLVSNGIALLGADSTVLLGDPIVPPADTSADEDGNLELTASDTNIDRATEASAVTMTVSGLDADADAVVEITDGATTVTGNLTDDGPIDIDVRTLGDGTLSTRVIATDTSSNEAIAAGPDLNLTTASGAFAIAPTTTQAEPMSVTQIAVNTTDAAGPVTFTGFT